MYKKRETILNRYSRGRVDVIVTAGRYLWHINQRSITVRLNLPRLSHYVYTSKMTYTQEDDLFFDCDFDGRISCPHLHLRFMVNKILIKNPNLYLVRSSRSRSSLQNFVRPVFGRKYKGQHGNGGGKKKDGLLYPNKRALNGHISNITKPLFYGLHVDQTTKNLPQQE